MLYETQLSAPEPEETTGMRKLISYFTAVLTALTMGILSFGTSAQAMPTAGMHSTALQDIAGTKQGLSRNVQYYPERRHYRDRPNYDRRYYDRRYDRPRNWQRQWNGPRWDHQRPRYRPHYRPYYQPNFRPAPPRYYRERTYRSGRNVHVNWCYNRYRSYRASDNTFQPNYGPRRQCYSPYI